MDASESNPPSHVGRQRLIALNALLALSAGEAALDKKLADALELVLRTAWVRTKHMGAIFLIDNDAGDLVLRASEGFTEEMKAGCARLPLGAGICGQVAAQKKAVSVRSSDDDKYKMCYQNMHCYARYSVPLLAGSRILGVIVQYLDDESFEEEAGLEFLRAVASTLASIIQRMEDEEQIRNLLRRNQSLVRRLMSIQEDERRRLARELHDEMGQSVTAIKADAVLIARRSGGQADDINRLAVSIVSIADHIYGIIRTVIGRLRPSMLDELGLVAAIEDLISSWRIRHKWLQFQLEMDGELNDLNEDFNIAIYRIVQECLVNAYRHAAASSVRICLERIIPRKEEASGMGSGESIFVKVSDNGCGMNVNYALEKTSRFGILGMRERVEGLGGDLHLYSKLGEGTQVVVTIPVSRTS